MRTPVLLALSLAFAASAAPGADPPHPLEGLTAEEITLATRLLREAGQVVDGTLIASMRLAAADKASVRSWQPGDPARRVVHVTLRRSGATYETRVDLSAGRVAAAREVPGVQPTIAWPEIARALRAPLADERVVAGLARRGIQELDALACAPFTAGNFGAELERTRRIVKSLCFDLSDRSPVTFASPIEGLVATVDLDTGEVLAVVDEAMTPMPPPAGDLRPPAEPRTVRPVEQRANRGSNLRRDGNRFEWQGWSFRVGWDDRAGVVLSTVAIKDGDRERSVLYEGFISELFVPYQDPSVGWYFRNYMDEGDYGLGGSTSALQAGSDCPADAVFLSPVAAGADGAPNVLANAICIFERAPLEPVWRHYDFLTQTTEARSAIELVVRTITTVGNYDYAFDWLFDQKGNLTFRGGASGIDAVKSVAARSLDAPGASEDTAYGPLIAPGRAGINHSHFFSVRMDLDVDGPVNHFVRDALVVETLPPGNPRRSIWRVRPEMARTEDASRYRLDFARPALWRVVNPGRRNALGYPVSYAIQARGNALPLLASDDPPLARAGFAEYHLWVTPYDPAERYAAGDYPNQSEPGSQGLPAWTRRQRRVDDTDIVLWYTLGFHHVPSAEDWPVYNLGWHSVTLRPYNFFDRNPAMDLPASPGTPPAPSTLPDKGAPTD